jgi:hypothetical protein
MKKILSFFLAIVLVTNLSGCETVRKKFTRKKKTVVKMPRIYQVRKYEKKPIAELYAKHFAYWVSWHSELLRTLGANHKKDKKCIEEIMNNLNDLRNMLLPEKAEALKVHMEKLERVRTVIEREELTQFNKSYVAMTLDREDRSIKRDFKLSKVKDFLKKDANDEERDGSGE